MKFYIHIEQDFAPVCKPVDQSVKYSTINFGIGYEFARQAWNNAKLTDAFMHKIYAPALESEHLTIIADLPVKPIVVNNYNGYTIQWVAETDERTGVITLEEYNEWKTTHYANWENGTWVYKPKQ